MKSAARPQQEIAHGKLLSQGDSEEIWGWGTPAGRLERKLAFWRRWFWYVSPDETAFVRWPLYHVLESSGFTEIEITPFDWLHPRVSPAWIKAVQRLGKRLEQTPILREFAGSRLIRARCPISNSLPRGPKR